MKKKKKNEKTYATFEMFYKYENYEYLIEFGRWDIFDDIQKTEEGARELLTEFIGERIQPEEMKEILIFRMGGQTRKIWLDKFENWNNIL